MDICRVLLVDDDDDIRLLGEMSLMASGRFTVMLAASGAEALEQVRTDAPDVILMDVTMPGMDGPAVVAWLRANPATAAIPVVLMTASSQRHEMEHLQTLGCAAVLRKPFDPRTLPAELRRAVADAAAATAALVPGQ